MILRQKRPIFIRGMNVYQHRSYVVALEHAADVKGMSLDGMAYIGSYAKHMQDCSCHGSRFEEDGTLIDNPANGDLTT